MYTKLRHSRGAELSLILFAAAAIAADLFTTYTALSTPGHVFFETTPALAALIASQGLSFGLLVSGLLRLAAFGLVALVATRVPRVLAVPLLIGGVLGAAWTWWIALGNVLTIARSGT
jgi:hypothetical protein